MRIHSRVTLYSTVINKAKCKPKALFSEINNLVKPSSAAINGSVDLCESFQSFFLRKIDNIYQDFSSSVSPHLFTCLIGHPLNTFLPTNISAVEQLVIKSNSASCTLDPIPTYLLKTLLPSLIQSITYIINRSLATGYVPQDLKIAAITPILKKPGLDNTDLNSFRPISNLPFVTKIPEKVVAAQLQSHLEKHNLCEQFQSGFRPSHSTETALLKVVNDLLKVSDSGAHSILVLFDLSAAFDTVCHSVLLSRLSAIGINGAVLQWLTSYLSDRRQFVRIDKNRSCTVTISRGVPQGSVLGPLLFLIYVLPLGQIIRRHGLNFHSYADDIQIYFTVQPSSVCPPPSIVFCLQELKTWMPDNFLQLNADKTEILLVGPKSQSSSQHDIFIDIDGVQIRPSTTVRNLGVLFDSALCFDSHIGQIVKSCFYQLRNIVRIRPSLNLADAETIIHVFITSRLDYCNSLYSGLPAKVINRLQMVQNSAARVLTFNKKSAHITPILHQLHWLPVPKRIQFKLLVLVYKAYNGLAPQYLVELVQPYVPARTLRSSNDNLLVVPKYKLSTVGGRAFCIIGPKLWNKLPHNVHAASSLQIFKSQLKTHLFTLFSK